MVVKLDVRKIFSLSITNADARCDLFAVTNLLIEKQSPFRLAWSRPRTDYETSVFRAIIDLCKISSRSSQDH